MGSGERMLEVNGVGLCVETFGDVRDPALLLIMGSASSMLLWEDELCERLAVGGRWFEIADDLPQFEEYPARPVSTSLCSGAWPLDTSRIAEPE